MARGKLVGATAGSHGRPPGSFVGLDRATTELGDREGQPPAIQEDPTPILAQGPCRNVCLAP